MNWRIFIILFVQFFIGEFFGHLFTSHYWKNEAISHKAAVYYIDSNNNKSFRWNDEEPK